MDNNKPKYEGRYIPYYKSGYHDKLDLPPMTGNFSRELRIFFNENHDHCTFCHTRFNYSELTHLGFDFEKKFIYACNKCSNQVEETVVRYGYSQRVYQIPSANSSLWRYMDFTKFVSILFNQALFVSSASMFNDPFEGARGLKENKESYDEAYINELAKALADKPEAIFDIPPSVEDIAKAKELHDQMSEHTYNACQHTFLNCWHENEVESDAMWYLYSKDITNAIAIKTG